MWITIHEWNQVALNKKSFPIKNIDIRIGFLAVNKQGHTNSLHRLEQAVDCP